MVGEAKKTIWIKTAKQWAVLESPVRTEILSLLELLGKCSVAELAEYMGRPADSLYHHLRKLQGIGVLKQETWRKVGKQTEAMYELVGPVRFDYDPATKRNATRFQRLAGAILRNAARDFNTATEHDGVVMAGQQKNLWIRQESARLTKSTLSQVNYHLSEIMRILKESRTAKRGQLHTWITVLVPRFQSRRHTKSKISQRRKSARENGKRS